MVFADLFFIYVFLPLCLISYFLTKGLERKNTVLIIFSLLFYAWGEPIYVFLLLFSAGFNWFAGLFIRNFRRNEGMQKLCVGLALG